MNVLEVHLISKMSKNQAKKGQNSPKRNIAEIDFEYMLTLYQLILQDQ